MKYQVPQFIDVEDKIFGPLTIKQFLYVAGGSALAYIIYAYIPYSFIGAIIALPVLIFFLALAFYKVNDRPFIFTVENAVKYFFSSKLYIWKKTPKKITPNVKEEEIKLATELPKLSESKLKNLTWSLDVNEKLNTFRGENVKTIQENRIENSEK